MFSDHERIVKLEEASIHASQTHSRLRAELAELERRIDAIEANMAAVAEERDELKAELEAHDAVCPFEGARKAQGRVFTHWLLHAAQRIAAGDTEVAVMREFGYVPDGPKPLTPEEARRDAAIERRLAEKYGADWRTKPMLTRVEPK